MNKKVITIVAAAAVVATALIVELGGPSAAGPGTARTMLAPHVFETKGRTTTAHHQDFEFHAAIHGGSIADSTAVDISWFNPAGGLIQASGKDVCGPCTLTLDSSHRKQSLRLETAITSKGGWGSQTSKSGYAVITITGPGADFVSVQGFVVNSHTSPFDVSVLGFTPEEITAPSP